MMKRKLLNITLMLLGFSSIQAACSNDDITLSAPHQAMTSTVGTFAKGADVGWLTQMESEGLTFSNRRGQTKELMTLLRDDCHVNAIRLRVWVNPSSGWNSIDDVLVKARRAQALGLRLMIDFHFSDIWADPTHQTIPAAWADYDLTQMKVAVAQHVTEMLTRLKTYNITPEWVQIGNETRTGMLWPMGDIDSGSNYAELNNAGYDAAKAVFPTTQVIVHIDCGDNLAFYTRVFDYLKQNAGKYDAIGMSLYPETGKSREYVDRCVSNINTLFTTYGKPIMLCEFGMDYDQAEECRDALSAIIAKGKATGHLEGVFYWEPQAPAGYNDGYTKGCFANGAPTVALDAFAENE
jgi:arabinogalactan endo-1,4-beta-galactosidase